MDFLRRHKLAVLGGSAALLAVVAFLAFGVFGVHTLFIDDKVDEANPFADTTVVSDSESAEPTAGADPGADTTATTEAAPTITTLASGQFQARDHPAEGLATVITDGTQTFLRFEDDFATDNGPDLNVYLSTAPADGDSGAFDDDFIDLGNLKGNIGGQNYELDPSIDVSRYQSVVVWCVRFSVPFGSAPLDAG